MRKKYNHSAYWYAYHYGWSYSEKRSYTGQYLDMHMYRPRQKLNKDGSPKTDWFGLDSGKVFDSTFNPTFLGICIAMDIGVAMRDKVRKLADPVERNRIKRELMRDLRRITRPFYYARETARRRELALSRRKIRRRTTTSAMPTPDEVLLAWQNRKASHEAMILLGGMIHDLECHVDNCLRFDETGAVVGRNGGIKGWLRECLPELLPKYKTLMRYKALAVRLRQATGTKDPTPTKELLSEPRNEVVKTLETETEIVFSHVFARLEHMISAETVFLDAPKPIKQKSRRQKA